MPAPKSLLKGLSVDRAKARHRCRQSKEHVIYKGDLRLTVKVGRDVDRYCVQCAQRFAAAAIAQLNLLVAELDVPEVH